MAPKPLMHACPVQVSGFAFWNYLKNAVQFEGAATLPFRWNAKRSALLDRLVLAGDFYTLAHAQKVLCLIDACTSGHAACVCSAVRTCCEGCQQTWLLLLTNDNI